MESIFRAFPQVSAEWLMRGEGDMFRPDGQSAADVSHDGNAPRSVGVENPAKADASLIEQLRKENATLLEQLRATGEQLKVKDEQIRNKDSQISALFALLSK